jgi:hypothetical protein
MRIARVILLGLVLMATVAVGVELVLFNGRLGGLPHMSTAETWQSPNLLSSLLFLLIAVGGGAGTLIVQPANRTSLLLAVLFSVVALLALWVVHRTCVGMIESGRSSGPISWW